MKTQILCAMRDGSAVIPALRTLEDEQDCAFRMVQSGEGALSAAKKCRPDILVIDAVLPLMDGLAAANNIRHLSNSDAKKVPIIAMTANAFEDDIEKSKAAGMNAHLAKPIEPQRLYQTLYDFIFGKED